MAGDHWRKLAQIRTDQRRTAAGPLPGNQEVVTADWLGDRITVPRGSVRDWVARGAGLTRLQRDSTNSWVVDFPRGSTGESSTSKRPPSLHSAPSGDGDEAWLESRFSADLSSQWQAATCPPPEFGVVSFPSTSSSNPVYGIAPGFPSTGSRPG